MAKSIKYPKFVIRKPCSDNRDINNNIKVRNLISVKISNNNNKKVLCVMMNPSKANSEQSDITVNKILNLLNSVKYNVGIIEIVNLYPVYKTKSGELFNTLQQLRKHGIEVYDKKIKENDQLIKSKIESTDVIIFAWGKSPKHMPRKTYKAQGEKILGYVLKNKNKHLYIFKTNRWTNLLTNLGNPRHPSRNTLVGISACEVDSSTSSICIIKK
ncbi:MULTISPECIES: DUF1643 domain-containing protein [Clostridium]|uniref:DUF1643 domain-containing protein n=1 Tax=Clostridium frigoriphilum TaxID=443253 RepID=A0ABU7UV08_9CLOT|nr:DUF1643 domain-containing protein [Clostridium sp. DSM 17811]MBU3102238.1 DUF1643 domain-containing protein [Clostridium sp. DSM 17811]